MMFSSRQIIQAKLEEACDISAAQNGWPVRASAKAISDGGTYPVVPGVYCWLLETHCSNKAPAKAKYEMLAC